MLGIMNFWRREGRSRRLLITLPFIGLTVLCLPVVGYLALGSLEWQYPPLRERPTDAGAIVVLGGGILPADSLRDRPELSRSTFDRCRYALALYRRGGPCPVLVSGGKVDPDPSVPTESRLMRDSLIEWGMDRSDVIEEGRSRSTYENAVESARIVRERGIRRIVLVTEATHMVRAMAVFRRQGIDAVAAPCSLKATRFDWSPFDFLPSPKAALDCQTVMHEWFGIAWYRLHGRL
jgi:uncharacterized SAM-binding protein YcdF (DUF218 family)